MVRPIGIIHRPSHLVGDGGDMAGMGARHFCREAPYST